MGGRDTTSQDRCQTVQDVAEELVASLKDYGVDADGLEELQEKIDAYAVCITKPRESVATGKNQTVHTPLQPWRGDIIGTLPLRRSL